MLVAIPVDHGSRDVAGGPWTSVKPLRRQQQRLVDVLGDSPGLNIDELSARLGLRRTAINYHVRTLLRCGAVVRLRQGRHALHFLSGTPAVQRTAFCLLRIPGVLAFCLDAFDHPRDAWSARAERLDFSRRHVRRVLHLLERNGLAKAEPGSRREATVQLHPDLRVLIVRSIGPLNGAAPRNPDLP